MLQEIKFTVREQYNNCRKLCRSRVYVWLCLILPSVHVTREFGHTLLIKWFLSVVPFEHSSSEVKIVYSLLNAVRTYLKKVY